MASRPMLFPAEPPLAPARLRPREWHPPSPPARDPPPFPRATTHRRRLHLIPDATRHTVSPRTCPPPSAPEPSRDTLPSGLVAGSLGGAPPAGVHGANRPLLSNSLPRRLYVLRPSRGPPVSPLKVLGRPAARSRNHALPPAPRPLAAVSGIGGAGARLGLLTPSLRRDFCMNVRHRAHSALWVSEVRSMSTVQDRRGFCRPVLTEESSTCSIRPRHLPKF